MKIKSQDNQKVNNKIDYYDRKLNAIQGGIIAFLDKRLTLRIALLFNMFLAGSVTFFGRDCMGSVSFFSPQAVFAGMMCLLGIILIIIFVPIKVYDLVRFFILTGCTYYLTYEVFGLISLRYVEYEKACKPFLFPDSFGSYFWAIVPYIFFILACFVIRKEKEK